MATGHGSPSRRYALLVGLTAGVAIAGYAGYVLYPRFDLPPVTGASLLALSAAAGIASFFSPCSFPLAITLLARESRAGEPGEQGRLTRLTLWLGLGALTFLVIAGTLIGAGAGAFFKEVTFTSAAGIAIRAIVGSLLILLGLIQLNILPISLLAVEDAAKPLLTHQARLRRERPGLAFGLFGFGYLLAGFG